MLDPRKLKKLLVQITGEIAGLTDLQAKALRRWGKHERECSKAIQPEQPE